MSKLFVVRHGMRIDHEDKNWKKTAVRTFDPPLSENGHEQARQTGRYLKQFDIKAVFASPLVRTIQTATGIADALKLSIYVENGLIEWLNPKWHDFSEGPLPLDLLSDQYPRLDLSYRPLLSPRYPEQEEVLCRERMAYVARQLNKEIEGDIVLVTHGAGVVNVVQALTGSRAGSNDKNCAVNILRRKMIGDGWVLESSTADHLKKSEDTATYI